MKLIVMALAVGILSGAADAADIFDLHRVGASEAAARGGQALPQVPGPLAAKTMEHWESVDLLAADGTRISVDYVPADLGGKVNATRIWVSVSNPRFTGTEKISAKLSNYYEAKPGSPEALKEASEQRLSFNGGSYQALAKFPDISLFEAFHSWQNDFSQSLTVTVNGANLQTGAGLGQFRFKLPGKPAWADDERGRPGAK